MTNFGLVFSHLLLVWAAVESVSNFPPRGVQSSVDSDKAPDRLVEAESEFLNNSTNHELGEQEISRHSIYSVPIDKAHFNYDDNDWTVYSIDNSSDKQIIVSSSDDATKKLRIRTSVKGGSNVIITYQIHLKSEENSVKPKFTVYLITGETKLLKEEDPVEGWKTSSIHVVTEVESELLFVGILKASGNEIALHSFQVQDLSSPIDNHRYGESIPSAEAEDILTGVDVHGDFFLSEDYEANQPDLSELSHTQASNDSVGVNTNGNRTTDVMSLNYTEHENSTQIYLDDSKFMNESDSISEYETDYQDEDQGGDGVYTNHEDEDNVTGMTDMNGTLGFQDDPNNPFELTTENLLLNMDNETLGNELNSTSSELNEVEESNGGGVFNFFIVVIVIMAAVVGFMWWRRRRKRKHEDEIPVFSRAATEHGNPTFTNSESNIDGLASDSQTNYRSFE